MWVLMALLMLAVLPVLGAYLWLRRRTPPLSLPWFLAAVIAGGLALFIAMFFQDLLSPFRLGSPGTIGHDLFYMIFIRVALVEELSRLIPLFFLLTFYRQRLESPGGPEPQAALGPPAFAGLSGLVAGLGFAALESAAYGMTDLSITLYRALGAAPLHGACGIRSGRALAMAPSQPLRALGLFASAVLIHGAYNLMIVSPLFPTFLAIPAALAALYTSLSPLLALRRAEPIY